MGNTIDFELEKRVLEEKMRIEEISGRKISKKGEEKIRQNIIKADKKAERRSNLKKAGIILGTAATAGAVLFASSGTKEETVPTPKPTIEASEEPGKINDIKEEVNNLENEEAVLRFLKNEYIENYEKITGDDTLTTEDITITYNYENYVYINDTTGEIITHGENIKNTTQSLQNDGVSYTTKDNVKVYKIKTKEDGKVIDCMTLQNQNGETKPVKVIVGDQYEESKNNNSILVEMGMVIPNGIDYMENMEKDEASQEITKKDFIKALETQEEVQEQTIEDDGMEL